MGEHHLHALTEPQSVARAQEGVPSRCLFDPAGARHEARAESRAMRRLSGLRGAQRGSDSRPNRRPSTKYDVLNRSMGLNTAFKRWNHGFRTSGE